MIVESRPWVVGQTLTHTNGQFYVATGTGSYKAKAPDIVVDEPEPIRQEHFYPGDTLPDWMIEDVQVCLEDGSYVDVYDGEDLPDDANGMVIVDAVTGKPTFNQKPVKLDDPRQTVFGAGEDTPEWMSEKIEVCLLVTGEVVDLCDGEEIPENIDGTIIVDALTGKPTYNQGAQKPVPVVKPIVSQTDEPTKEEVLSGVCIWRNLADGCLYTVTIEADGSCTWFSSDKNDTNTFATVIEAPASGVDDYDNQYSASQDLIVFADDTIMAMAVDTDTVGSVSGNAAGVGGGVGTATVAFPATDNAPASSKDNLVCGVQSATELNPTTGLQETKLNNGSVLVTCPTPVKFIRDDQDTGEVVAYTVDDSGNEVEIHRWFNAAPTNRTKVQLAPADGQVTDGNGVAVNATSISGEPILSGDRVIVECDEDGNVVRVQINALPKDCVLSVGGISPDPDGDVDPQDFLPTCSGSSISPTNAIIDQASVLPDTDWPHLDTPSDCGEPVYKGSDGKLYIAPRPYEIMALETGLNIPVISPAELFADAGYIDTGAAVQNTGVVPLTQYGEMTAQITIPEELCLCGTANFHANGIMLQMTTDEAAAGVQVYAFNLFYEISINGGAWSNQGIYGAGTNYLGAQFPDSQALRASGSDLKDRVPGRFCPGDMLEVKIRKSASMIANLAAFDPALNTKRFNSASVKLCLNFDSE